MLILINDLSLPTMDHNLIPSFVMIKAAGNVMTTPKIQAEDLSIDDHSAYLTKENLSMPLKCYGVFSYFPSTKPSIDMLDESDQVILMKYNGTWNPQNIAYSKMEESMLNV